MAPGWRCCTFDGMTRALEKFRLALLASLSHDVFGSAKGAAYSAILCLFPTILVLTTLLALTPESDTLRGEMRAALRRGAAQRYHEPAARLLHQPEGPLRTGALLRHRGQPVRRHGHDALADGGLPPGLRAAAARMELLGGAPGGLCHGSLVPGAPGFCHRHGCFRAPDRRMGDQQQLSRARASTCFSSGAWCAGPSA